jgi:hypothetical protein
MIKLFYCMLITISLLGCVICQEDSTETIKEYKHSIQMGTLDWVFGNATMNYELLLQQKYGIVLEGSYPLLNQNTGYAFSAQYRKHKTPGMKAGFWGLFVQYIKDNGKMKIKEDDQNKEFAYRASSFIAGAYFGEKWVWAHGINLTYRLGYGIPFSSFKWENDIPEQRKLVEAFYKIFIGVDVEVTIGICF